MPAIPIISGLFSLAQSWLEGRKRVQEARDERAAELVRQQGSWEEIMAQGSVTSWKDEWLTILVSIPLILAFIPPAIPYVKAGFAALEQMPEWYRYLVSIVFAASFGVKSAIGLLREKEPWPVK